MTEKFVSQVFWPLHCTSARPGYLIGWNVRHFMCSVVAVVDADSVGSLRQLEEKLARLTSDAGAARIIEHCCLSGTPPVVLGACDMEGGGSASDDCAEVAAKRGSANIWLTMCTEPVGAETVNAAPELDARLRHMLDVGTCMGTGTGTGMGMGTGAGAGTRVAAGSGAGVGRNDAATGVDGGGGLSGQSGARARAPAPLAAATWLVLVLWAPLFCARGLAGLATWLSTRRLPGVLPGVGGKQLRDVSLLCQTLHARAIEVFSWHSRHKWLRARLRDPYTQHADAGGAVGAGGGGAWDERRRAFGVDTAVRGSTLVLGAESRAGRTPAPGSLGVPYLHNPCFGYAALLSAVARVLLDVALGWVICYVLVSNSASHVVENMGTEEAPGAVGGGANATCLDGAAVANSICGHATSTGLATGGDVSASASPVDTQASAPGAVLYLVHRFFQYLHVDVLRDRIKWLMATPAGFKLNASVNYALGSALLRALHGWNSFTTILTPLEPAIVVCLGLSGLFGCTVFVAFASDLLRLVTAHVYVIFRVFSKIHNVQLHLLSTMWKLFRGKKRNVLRNRVDSCEADTNQLLLGTLVFTMSVFMFTTFVVYYVFFLLVWLLVQAVQAVLWLIYILLDFLPAYSVVQHLIDPICFPNGIHIDVEPLAMQQQRRQQEEGRGGEVQEHAEEHEKQEEEESGQDEEQQQQQRQRQQQQHILPRSWSLSDIGNVMTRTTKAGDAGNDVPARDAEK
eukprot:g3409.t1